VFGSQSRGRIELVESRFRAGLGHRSRRTSVPCTAPILRALKARYASARFEPVARDLPPDHITVELHFLGHLLEQASDGGPDAWRAIREARSFLRDHVLSWLPALRAALATRPDGGFYLAIVATAEANARALRRDLA
jgi:TorA maturation chaperone TorD